MVLSDQKIIGHYTKIWKYDYIIYNKITGPLLKLNPQFKILIFPPDEKRNMWTYATCGMSRTKGSKLELHMFSINKNDRIIDILISIAHYHMTEKPLNLGHSVNFGIPWYENSICTYGLISLPYLDGCELQWDNFNETQYLWLIPITKGEVEYKKLYGLDKLEGNFEEQDFDYLDYYRKCTTQ